MAASGKGTSKSAELRRAAGQVLIVGVQEAELSGLERAWLKLIRPGGIILFRRNIESPAQTHHLLAAANQACGGSALLRCVDVEGGTVDRLRDLIAPMPSPAAVAATRSRRLFAAHGRLIGQELRLLGFNVNLAPVLDLLTEASSSVMAGRVAGSTPEQVVEYASQFIAGLRGQGILGCGKHFPGLGAGAVDSHHLTPQIEKPFDSIWREDLLPYRRLVEQLPLVMISHAGYPQTPSGTEPASISRYWIDGVLRKKLGFRGLIVSDDMEMGGILSYTSLEDAAIRAILAGTHRVEICHDPARVIAAYEAVLTEAERSPAFARQLLLRAFPSLSPEHMPRQKMPKTPTTHAVNLLRDEVLRFADAVDLQNGQGRTMPSEIPAGKGRRTGPKSVQTGGALKGPGAGK